MLAELQLVLHNMCVATVSSPASKWHHVSGCSSYIRFGVQKQNHPSWKTRNSHTNNIGTTTVTVVSSSSSSNNNNNNGGGSGGGDDNRGEAADHHNDTTTTPVMTLGMTHHHHRK